ncbi:hypothetical protein IQ279_14270 [Streptomyces verrucosisporus]|uniref:hypothetical protein n=1 Tax=Streptomyces verrucosisporus TaxID=1695161 RepID=UPI0019D076A1|nr:hypothetical protein [Streptomyces verrucosisporus]MBN3930787.1 hypothetical protein [Streptomyces verrucosisporus]
MMHSEESLEAEAERLRRRPAAESAPPVLSEFTVDLPGDPDRYAERLRSVLSAAVNLGIAADFEQEELPTEGVPGWFAAVCAPGGEGVPDFAGDGRGAYESHTQSRPWSLQNWLYRFDPDDDSRGWQWWDVTRAGPSHVHIWVDSWGESFFGCQELRWAAYTAGALRVDGPVVRRSSAWAEGTPV